jgi:predicted nucleic acid-binding protein
VSRIVLDASVVLRAMLPTQYLPSAESILHMPGVERFAPDILRQEFYNVLLKTERRRTISIQAADALAIRFNSEPIRYVSRENWVLRAWPFARQFSLGLFDTIHLVCAEDLDAELWTCDRQFVARLGSSRPPRVKLCPDDAAPAAEL